MTTKVLTVDALCDALTDMLREVNASLASEALASSCCGGTASLDQCSLLTNCSLQHTYRYQLNALSFSLPCCAVTRRIDHAQHIVLALRIPAWWQRIGRSPVYRQLHIDVRPDATALRFTPIQRSAMPHRGKQRTLLLSQNQKLILALSTDATKATRDEAPRATTKHAFHHRIAQWLRGKPASDAPDVR
ncbi:hypothetical protein [Paraburkholderia rhizosphaerae]|uniref:Uncharacterized protein n=1 Tax=Paraburkholderia rhizosphaerae TaxID=480658 RepID=A0A4V3HDT4_9BURK|nr:hypothetical protein [Paraburkholderia rhizosphaerae]TDY42204.1 hypothetical protein BX592_12213 [Paraburkholderia rhizosphaerae]